MWYTAGWSSLVARRAHNPEVAGSNPAPATKSCSGGTVSASEQECEELAEQLHGRKYGHFSLSCEVVIDVQTMSFAISVTAVNEKVPDSDELPLLELPVGWQFRYWYRAQAAG